jgi:hypothetical protein
MIAVVVGVAIVHSEIAERQVASWVNQKYPELRDRRCQLTRDGRAISIDPQRFVDDGQSNVAERAYGNGACKSIDATLRERQEIQAGVSNIKDESIYVARDWD